MPSITTMVVGLWVTMAVAPSTPIGRALARWMVERPAARLAQITRGHVLLVLLLVAGAATIGWAVGREGVVLTASGVPELATWITMFEITAYLDALAAVVTVASITRIEGIKAWVRGVVSRRAPSTTRSRRRAVRLRKPAPANDDGRPVCRAFAA